MLRGMDAAAASLRESYRRNGFAFPLDAMPADEAAAFRARVEALEAGPVGYGPEAQKLYRFKPYLLFAWAAELVRHRGVLDAVEQVIGPDIMVWAAGLFIKEPHDPTAIKWHQDGYYMGLSDPDRAVRAWIALTETTVANGTMSFIPGSHGRGFVRHSEDDSVRKLALRGEHIAAPEGEAGAVPVLLRPGQVSLHHLKTIHGSPGNGTGARRMTLAVSYVAPDVQPRGGRDTAMLVRGEDRHGHWLQETAVPAKEYDTGCRAAHARAMEVRLAAYQGAVMPDP